MAALTLIESAKLFANDGKYFEAAVVQMFAEANEVTRILPIQSITGSAIQYNQEGELPAIAFRGLNEGYIAGVGAINPQTEALRMAGGDVDVDNFIIVTHGTEARSTHERMKIKAIMDDFQKKFIKGDSSSNPKEFDGLQRRLTGTQVVSNKRVTSSAGGEVLSLNKLDEAIDQVVEPTHILMSKAMKRRMSQAQRNTSVGGNIEYGLDDFGRKVMFYGGLPVVALEDAKGGDTVLPFEEAASDAGGTAVNTSIYVVSLKEGHLQGIEATGGMSIRDLGEIDEKPVHRTRVEWYMSIALKHGRAAARLRDIIDGAVVA